MPRPRRTSLLLALACAALLAACGGDDEGGDADLEGVDAAEVLETSAARMEELDSFHFEVEHENGATEIIGGLQMVSATGDVQGAERMRLDVEARFASTNIQTGIVILPGEDYLQNPLTGRWEAQDEIDVSQIFDPASGVTGLMRNVRDAEVVDVESVDGVDSYVIEATIDAGELRSFVSTAEAGREVTARVWVGVDDSLVRRIEVRGPIAPNDADEVVRRITLSEFDEPVEIAPPR